MLENSNSPEKTRSLLLNETLKNSSIELHSNIRGESNKTIIPLRIKLHSMKKWRLII
jgi:hypothetical protein